MLTSLKEQVEHTYPGVYKNAFFSKLLSAVDTSARDLLSVFYEEIRTKHVSNLSFGNHLKV